ncbi:hypothetical protein IT568_03735 [bacterium]|nr:hypothetical protein [bacterium]
MKETEKREYEVEKLGDTYRYVLKRGIETVYYGITKNKDKSEIGKENSDKNFTKMIFFPVPVNEQIAEEWQKLSIKSYFQRTKGKTPEYHKN